MAGAGTPEGAARGPSPAAPRPHSAWPVRVVTAVKPRLPLGYASPKDCRAFTLWEAGMLWTIFVILLVLWLLGMVSSYTMGGFIHILLVIALAIILIRVIQGRRPV